MIITCVSCTRECSYFLQHRTHMLWLYCLVRPIWPGCASQSVYMDQVCVALKNLHIGPLGQDKLWSSRASHALANALIFYNIARTCSDYIVSFGRFDQAVRAKVFIWKKLAREGGWSYHHNRVNSGGLLTPLARQTVLFLMLLRFSKTRGLWN